MLQDPLSRCEQVYLPFQGGGGVDEPSLLALHCQGRRSSIVGTSLNLPVRQLILYQAPLIRLLLPVEVLDRDQALRGPVRQSRSLQLGRLGMLAIVDTQWPKEGPLEPLATLVLGTWFLLREIELAAAKLCDLTVDVAASQVSLRIPASKTDTAGLGSTRTHRCICGAPCNLAHCPLRAALCVFDSASHLARLHGRSADLFPLFPNHQGRHCTKAAIVATIEAAANGLGEPLLDAQGRRLFGGHSLRVGGAKWLAEQGVARDEHDC